ncbi:hypothetical protein J437_LFUL011216 [Ladona fulva]|uniref:Uncharacterized protein n=1 Tax=Ladona fulva TaxID=123851 RepID=A0A8K0KB63_LADFU|nr:hypothetical protein J437_LFUL011216 [Ladona fulva]
MTPETNMMFNDEAFSKMKKTAVLINVGRGVRADLLEKVKGVNAIFWFTKEKMDREMLDAAGGNLKVIATMSSGYDHIDVEEVKRRGILIGNVPQVLHNAVAELAIGLFIAAARLVDHDALIRALKEEKIWAAGLDVMTPEPLPPDHPLTSLKNCFLLPHLGSATFRTREEMATLTARNILCGLDGEPLPSPLVI